MPRPINIGQATVYAGGQVWHLEGYSIEESYDAQRGYEVVVRGRPWALDWAAMSGTAVAMPRHMGTATRYYEDEAIDLNWQDNSGMRSFELPAAGSGDRYAPSPDFVPVLARFVREAPDRAIGRAVLADLTANDALQTNALWLAGALVRPFLAPPRPDDLAAARSRLTLTLTDDYAMRQAVAAWAIDAWLAACREAFYAA